MLAMLRRYLCQERVPIKYVASFMCTDSPSVGTKKNGETITVLDQTYKTDQYTNISPKIIKKININLHNQKYHPLNLLKLRIQNYFHSNFVNRRSNPTFAIFDSISPVVTVEQNYDSLLVPKDHPSRKKSDAYYINSDYMLRAHTSSHQSDIIKSGLDAFLVFGDVYRRDQIDSSHYPVFHQVEGVRLYSQHELFSTEDLKLFENGQETPTKQAFHSQLAADVVTNDLKSTLENLAARLFGKDTEMRWVETYFPFTHPSWELEVKFQGEWLEVLGCGTMQQEILYSAGAGEKIGWAFGLGLERLAMKMYDIPDIRYFWSKDSGFTHQFQVEDPETPITFKPFSKHPQCINDISFWLPENYSDNDFNDLVRNVGGDLVESVTLIDSFIHSKNQRESHCYRIVYRHTDKALTQEEVNRIHKLIEESVTKEIGGSIR